MEKELNKIQFKIDEVKVLEYSCIYKVILKIPMKLGWIDNVEVVFDNKEYSLKHKNNDSDYASFESEIELPTKAIYHYYFRFKINNNDIVYNKNNTNTIDIKDMWKMSVNFKVPSWAKGGIIYHIFIDRFNRGIKYKEEMPNRLLHKSWDEDIIPGEVNGMWNIDFYGGDIQGIIDKLDYLETLNVTIIYLSPIFLSPSNHRYDTSDYEILDPYVGSNEDLKRLCIEAHKRGIHIVLDAVFNHTGNDSKYFNEFNNFNELGAYQSKDSKYYSFYKKNNIDEFEYWWGMKNLPVCDDNSTKWQEYIYGVGGVIDLWFSLGIDGLRLDVADELTDEFIEGVRRAVKRNKEDGFIIGEVWKNPLHMNRGYIESGRGMDTVMNYQLLDALIKYFKYGDCTTLINVLESIIVEYPTDTTLSLMNPTSTHDISRALNIFSSNDFSNNSEWVWDLINNDRLWEKNYTLKEEKEKGKKLYTQFIHTLAFLPGNISIFYGDEIGMEGMGNLANRRPFTWNKIDTDILEIFQTISKIRKKEDYLKEASLEIVDINPKYLVFKRKNNNIELIIYISRVDYTVNIIPKKELEILYSSNNPTYKELTPYSTIVLKKEKF